MEHTYRSADSERSPRLTPQSGTAAPRGTARGSGASGTAHDDGWAHVWFTASPEGWSTLVVVPASRSFNVIAISAALTAAGETYGHADIQLLDATAVEPGAIGGFIDTSVRRAANGQKTIIAVDSPFDNPAAISIARNADVAILAVALGTTKLSEARRTTEIIGHDRFVGAVAIGADGRPDAVR